MVLWADSWSENSAAVSFPYRILTGKIRKMPKRNKIVGADGTLFDLSAPLFIFLSYSNLSAQNFVRGRWQRNKLHEFRMNFIAIWCYRFFGSDYRYRGSPLSTNSLCTIPGIVRFEIVLISTLISLINVEVGINVEGVQNMQNY